MKVNSSLQKIFNFAALLLIMPAAWFFFINVLNASGISGPYNTSAPFFEKWGSNETLGWNINLLILLGPIFSLLLSLYQVLSLKWQFSKERFQVHMNIRKKWFPLSVALLSGLILASLFMYLITENY